MAFRFQLLLVCIFFTLPLSADDATIEKRNTISLGYIEFPPVFSTNKQGQAEGMLIELAALVIPRAGYQWKSYSFPTKRMADSLARGQLDLWIGLSTLPEFAGTTLVGKSTVATIELNSYWLDDLPPIKSKEDLAGKKVIIVHGFSYGGWASFIHTPEKKVIECRAFTHEQAVNMLKYKRCAYLLNYTGPMQKQLAEIDIPNLKKHRISALEARFVVSKKHKNAEQLLQDLENAYADIVAEGLWPLK